MAEGRLPRRRSRRPHIGFEPDQGVNLTLLHAARRLLTAPFTDDELISHLERA